MMRKRGAADRALADKDLVHYQAGVAVQVEESHAALLAHGAVLRRKVRRNQDRGGVALPAVRAGAQLFQCLPHAVGFGVGHAANQRVILAEDVDICQDVSFAVGRLELDIASLDRINLM